MVVVVMLGVVRRRHPKLELGNVASFITLRPSPKVRSP